MRIEWSPQAEREVDEIWQFIAGDNPDAADRIVEKFYSVAMFLGNHPRLGRTGRSRQTRELIISGTPYIVLYRTGRERVEILHVIHGARDSSKRRKRT